MLTQSTPHEKHRSRAPKARPIPAWGEAPGTAAQGARGLKARPIPASVPNVPLIELDTILPQERPKLILKRLPAMMLFLRIDVIEQRVQIRWAHRERTITALPRKASQLWRSCFKPPGRRCLQLCNHVRNTLRPSYTNREMHMIRNTANPEAFTIAVSRDRCKVGVQLDPHVAIENRKSIFGREDKMNQQKAQRLGHGRNYRLAL
jgi:hypothetical protein